MSFHEPMVIVADADDALAFASPSKSKRGSSGEFRITKVPAPEETGSLRPDWKLPQGFSVMPTAGFTDDGWPRRIQHEQTGSILAVVPASVSLLGSNAGPPHSRPQLQVFVNTFYMEIHEVTVAAFNNFRSEAKEKEKKSEAPLNETEDGRYPVLGIPWSRALAYAKWAGMELPTEVEFEKAIRGPEGLRTPWGNTRPIWAEERTPADISPVMRHPTDCSLYGIFDLAGNAREWCHDWYSPKGHEDAAATGDSPLRNWNGIKKPVPPGLRRVVKGGAEDWSAWSREGVDVNQRQPDVGLRCVLRPVLDDKEKSKKPDDGKKAKRGPPGTPGNNPPGTRPGTGTPKTKMKEPDTGGPQLGN